MPDVTNLIASGNLPKASRFIGGLNQESEAQQKERERDMNAVATAYASSGAVCGSCDVAGVSYQTYYRWLREDIRFQELMKEAHQRYLEKWEGRADRIALKNEESANPNPIMTIFTLKALAPNKYGDKIRVEDTRLDRLLEMTKRQGELEDRQRGEWIEGEAKVLPEAPGDEASSS